MTKDIDDRRLIVIGDVHGCIDELKELLVKCKYEGEKKDRLIFVGDLVDKGPASEEVLEFVMTHHAESVLGNHDDKHVRWARWEQKVLTGEADKNPMKHNGYYWPTSHNQRRFLAEMPLYLRLPGNWLVVHAGFEGTGSPIEGMDKNVMMRIRDVHKDTGRYLSTGDPAVRGEGAVRWPERWKGSKSVIYGHAPSYGVVRDRVPAGPICLGIDTGCVHGGYLTAVLIDHLGMVFNFRQVRAAKAYAPPFRDGEDYERYAKAEDPLYAPGRRK